MCTHTLTVCKRLTDLPGTLKWPVKCTKLIMTAVLNPATKARNFHSINISWYIQCNKVHKYCHLCSQQHQKCCSPSHTLDVCKFCVCTFLFLNSNKSTQNLLSRCIIPSSAGPPWWKLGPGQGYVAQQDKPDSSEWQACAWNCPAAWYGRWCDLQRLKLASLPL